MRCLITGFCGTLGKSFTDKLLARGDIVVGIDNHEWSVAAYPDHDNLTKQVGNFPGSADKYDLIVHCAAYKHVDLGESCRVSYYENNVTYTEWLYEMSEGKVLFISTDKAVRPISFYGQTKFLGERKTKEIGGVIARLGNIMASSGSVIPKWEACIAENKPLQVTDLTMTRWMIPVDDAVDKILALLEKAEPKQVIIPEMGDPIQLIDLIRAVLDKHGLGYDYPIHITGIRPGEKINEELTWDYEKVIYEDTNGKIYEGEEHEKNKAT